MFPLCMYVYSHELSDDYRKQNSLRDSGDLKIFCLNLRSFPQLVKVPTFLYSIIFVSATEID